MTIQKGGFRAKYQGAYLGMFDTAQEAQAAIDAARRHGPCIPCKIHASIGGCGYPVDKLWKGCG